ncbi:MAG TPA: rod shape-determining protein MreD [Opitutaceae bacterium]|nr:rod shape-determining protein MreD [Opitutaceae bacterium]
MRRPLVLFATLFLLWVLVAQANHELSGFRVTLFLGGLFTVFAAIWLPRTEGLLTVFASGLLFDVGTPVWFGCHALLFSLAHTVIHHFRKRMPRDEAWVSVVVALLANLGIFLGVSFSAFHDLPAPTNVWPRLLTDLLLSQIVLALIAPWFFALQLKAFEITRVVLPAEEHSVR